MGLLRVLLLWLCLLALPFATLLAVDAAHGPSTHAADAVACTRTCHDRGCAHLALRVDVSRPAVRAARAVYEANIDALAAPSIGYRDTNLVVYVVGFPALFAALLLVILLRRPAARGWRPLLVGGGLLSGLVGVVALQIDALAAWGTGRSAVYWLCTDFCIHVANLTGLTYEGFNFALFVVGFPLTAVLLAGLAARG